jgi:hypothetical protein
MKHLQHHYSRLISLSSLLGALTMAVGASAQTCPSYPIALPAQVLADVPTNTVVDVLNGTDLDNFGWLTWTGDPGEAALETSLTAPGDSSTYVNPDDPTDNEIDVGDWVTGRSGVSNRSSVRGVLDNLVDVDIIVPVFDDVRVTGDTVAFHVAGFAQVRLVGYRLPSQNKITILFLGFTDCSSGDGGPNV